MDWVALPQDIIREGDRGDSMYVVQSGMPSRHTAAHTATEGAGLARRRR